MSLTESFEQAATEINSLKTRPDNNTLLRLYSLHKQASVGDAPAESSAGMFDFVAKAKYTAWAEQRGKSKEVAMEEYVQLAHSLMEGGK